MGGDEVVFLFKNSSSAERRWAAARGEARPDSPQRELIGFECVTLAPGERATVTFNVTAERLSSVDVLYTYADGDVAHGARIKKRRAAAYAAAAPGTQRRVPGPDPLAAPMGGVRTHGARKITAQTARA